ncbi:tRNA (guanosine(46)-N7)-methyltransferase TrmB [Niallia sp. NCCP-28]|uniref:tRNA (guanosine(46)-N7)-methyltransferase TrmB n=1 Tax=Niallia sp. NCCP-28 TaxID=2934712 RepID=UPI00207F2BB8|nr:tRNA (guanosine(46)-N7)-methyltransferase TrmB [Niallia sp. NCCP-28]GKU84837.1 tRNA (guanine-N(7)-)-methyltransferase [Niallia sp. NCCP-28]
MRVRHKPWAKDKLSAYPQYVVQNPEENRGNWQNIFEQKGPIHIEVGTGKGRFISEMAKANPSINYIGIEIQESVIVTALDRLIDADVPNIRLMNSNAADLTTFFAENEIDRVYLNFSDPWPKTRHEKRRLTYKTFLNTYEKILVKNGEIHFKTDNQGLFEYSLWSFSQYNMLLKYISLDLHNSNYEGNIETEYEEKFSNKGSRIYRCEVQFK